MKLLVPLFAPTQRPARWGRYHPVAVDDTKLHGSVSFRANRVKTVVSSIYNPLFLLATRGGDGAISHPKKPVWREI
jgi:hypothetical protein